MKTYNKPIVNSIGITEGIFAASGSSDTIEEETCYTANAYIHQTPELGRDDYRIQINGQHHGDHTKDRQVLVISFNQPVHYNWSGGNLLSGEGTSTLEIEYWYHQNPTDNIGLGDLSVTAPEGLAITAVKIYD